MLDINDMELVHVQDIGDTVLCDQCNGDFTESDESGGFLFGSHGVCPRCAPRMLRTIEGYNEQEYIKAWCPPDMPFRTFILKLRGGDNTIKTYVERKS